MTQCLRMKEFHSVYTMLSVRYSQLVAACKCSMDWNTHCSDTEQMFYCGSEKSIHRLLLKILSESDLSSFFVIFGDYFIECCKSQCLDSVQIGI